MKFGFAFAGPALALSLAACAGTADPSAPDRIRATGLEVAEDPKVDVRYPALLSYEAAGDVRVVDSCFFWTELSDDELWLVDEAWFGHGPYCFAAEGGPAGAVRSMLVTGYPGTYVVEGYVRYASGGVLRHSNSVSSEITVTRRH